MTSALLELSEIARAVQLVNTARVRNKDNIGASDEKSAFNDSDDLPDPLF